ncbi:MAG: hypothetical protein ABWY49_03415 [Rhizobium sp.]
MVTALSSTRLIAAQLALKVLQADDTTDTSSSDGSSLGSSISNDVSSLPSSAQASLASMLNSLSNSQADDATTPASSDTASTATASTDITTASFMALLKQNLTATAAGSSDGAKQAQAMLAALDAGTLTVSDPTIGVSITAWDPTAAANNATPSATAGATANTATAIPTADWNDYLKDHLQRNSDGTFTRAADNSFVDKTSGNEAYFGQVGTQFYYLTWAGAGGTAAASDGTAGVAATDATSA